MEWMPLSQRSGESPGQLGPHEGVPDWLVHSLSDWCDRRFWRRADLGYARDKERLNRVERRLKLKLPTGSFESRLEALMRTVHEDPVLFIDLVELLLSEIEPNRYSDEYKDAAHLARCLAEAGSVWRVAERDQAFTLERRLDEEVAQAVEQVLQVPDRPGQLLRRAWQAVYGRRKEASTAYREAVRAVEAAAKPAVLPNDRVATLGKMIKAIRDAPQKWEFVLQARAGDSVGMVLATMELLWTAQLDRHGTDDPSTPLAVSDLEAESAVHLAVTLVHWFRIEAFRRRSNQT